MSLQVARGEIVALIGHNGALKSALLKAVFVMIPIWQGQVLFNGEAVKSPKPREWLRMGVAYMPQGNRVFADLTVQENLEMGGITLPTKHVVKDGIECMSCEQAAFLSVVRLHWVDPSEELPPGLAGLGEPCLC